MLEEYQNDAHNKQKDITTALEYFGFDFTRAEIAILNAVVKPQKYAKIKAIDERVRKHFIMWASDNHKIYSLGRFATWRPGLLLDDVVNDIRVIQHVATQGNYDHRKVIANG